MTKHWRIWLASMLFAVAVFQFVFALALAIAVSSLFEALQNEQVLFLVVSGSLALVGLILAIHRPRNPIGWIFLVASMAQLNIAVTDRYATYLADQVTGTPLDLTVLILFTNWTLYAAFFLPVTFGILLFPTGRLPSRRWRLPAWIGGSLLLVVVLTSIIKPGLLEVPPDWPHEVSNPTGIEALEAPVEFVQGIALGLSMLFVLISAASLFIRIRGATVQERQQLKWLGYAVSISVTSFFISTLESVTTSTNIGWFVLLLGLVAQPIAIGIAILRHNLYDIDRLINRTLVYGLLTLLLLLGFASNVILFQVLLSPFTSGNDLAVAGSTLLVFALFRPVRNRLQQFVDRRFYRQKYDARSTLERFSLSSRHAVDLDQITGELAGLVSSTMQPEHVSVWLRRSETGVKE